MPGSDKLHLHPTKGVNPRVTICPRCAVATGVALLGREDKLYACSGCGARTLGRDGACPLCERNGVKAEWKPDGELPDEARLMGDLCDECYKQEKEHAEIVKAGGIYFRCVDCGVSGVIRPNAVLAVNVRESSGVKAPDPVGFEFDKRTCPKCSDQKPIDEEEKEQEST